MKKWLTIVIMCTLVLSLLAGCSSSEKNADEAKSNASTNETAGEQESQEPVTLKFSFPASSDAEKQWVADFDAFIKEKYPNVTIEWLNIPSGDLLKKITVMVQAGDVPDLIAAQEITDFVKMGALEPLSGYLNKDEDLKPEKFNQGALDYSKIDGEIYTIPTLAIGYALLVNTDVIGKAGFKAEDIKTWDDYLKVAKAITKDGTYAHALAGSNPRFAFRDFYIAAASNGIMYDKLTDPANRSKLVELMKFYMELKPYMIPDVQSAEWANIHRNIVDSKVGFLGTGTYFSGYLSGFSPESINYLRPIPFPKGPSVDQSKALIGNLGLGIFKDSKNKELAWKILKEALNDRFAAQLAGSINVTAINDLPESALEQEVKKYYADHLDAQMEILDDWKKIMTENGVPQPKLSGQTEIERIYQDKFFKMLLGNITPEQMVDEFVAEVQNIEKQYQ